LIRCAHRQSLVGKTGYAIASAGRRRRRAVLISGPVARPPAEVKLVKVENARGVGRLRSRAARRYRHMPRPWPTGGRNPATSSSRSAIPPRPSSGREPDILAALSRRFAPPSWSSDRRDGRRHHNGYGSGLPGCGGLSPTTCLNAQGTSVVRATTTACIS
jgi:hypothetical protein